MNQKDNSMPLNELLAQNLSKLTTRITYIVLFSFMLVLTLLLIKAWLEYEIKDGSNIGQEWLNLFRDGFIILSGILTTLIGYYFGNRGSESALSQIEEIKKENERLLSNLDSIAPTIESEDAGIDPIIINEM